MTTIRLFVAGVLLLCMATTSASVTLYSTLGPGDSFGAIVNNVVGKTIGGPTSYTAPVVSAHRFRAASTGYLGQIDFAVGFIEPDAAGNYPLRLSLHRDLIVEDTLPQPGEVLESLTFTVPASAVQAGSNSILVSALATGTTLVEAGIRYWLSIAPLTDDRTTTVDNLWAFWALADPVTNGLNSYLGSNAFPDDWFALPNTPAPAYRLSALTAVPVPAAGPLFALAGLSLLSLRRRSGRGSPSVQ